MRTILIPAISHTKQAMRSNVRFLTIGGPTFLKCLENEVDSCRIVSFLIIFITKVYVQKVSISLQYNFKMGSIYNI